MKKTVLAFGLLGLTFTKPALAAEGGVPQGVPRLEHVFVVMMENHGFSQIINNPNAPFINKYAKTANLGTNYFAIAHPSLTNYLEIVAGSNFGIQTDNYPDWHNATCMPKLASGVTAGTVPSLSFIAPNQCNDQHGRGNAGPFCNFEPKSDGSQSGLNPALIYRGDVTVQKLVTAIHRSRAWRDGNNAIVVVWDENDYSLAPNINQVAVIVDTNYGDHGLSSARRYTHFSLLRSLEAGFRLPCLNHACDADIAVMSDLFSR
jgi:hypothetical protein